LLLVGKIDSIFLKRSSYPRVLGFSSSLRKGIMSTYCDIRMRFVQDFTTGYNLETATATLRSQSFWRLFSMPSAPLSAANRSSRLADCTTDLLKSGM
jgi:hypothetical protein